MHKPHATAIVGGILAFTSLSSLAFDQWAGKVVDFSSQYGSPDWSAKQLLGASNVDTYGDNALAWAPSSENGTHEFVTVSYEMPVYATGVTVRETLGNGFVTSVEATDPQGNVHIVWSGNDDSRAGQINDFLVTFPQTKYLVSQVTVRIDTSAGDGWEEVDSIQLHGVPTVSGTLSPSMGHTATLTCINVTTGQRVTQQITGPGKSRPVSSWDCDKAGLKSKKGQEVKFQIETTRSD